MIRRLLGLPRLVRILLVAMSSLSVVLAIFALVDRIYIQYLLTPETVILPSFVSVGLGLGMYVWGWILLVGQRGKRLPPAKWLGLYLLISVFCIVINIGLIVQGISMTDYVAG